MDDSFAEGSHSLFFLHFTFVEEVWIIDGVMGRRVVTQRDTLVPTNKVSLSYLTRFIIQVKLIEYLIRWQGFGSEDDSWHTYNSYCTYACSITVWMTSMGAPLIISKKLKNLKETIRKRNRSRKNRRLLIIICRMERRCLGST